MVFARVAARSFARPASSLLAGQASPHFARRAPPIFTGASSFAKRTLTATAARQGKVLLVLYDVSEPSVHLNVNAEAVTGQ